MEWMTVEMKSRMRATAPVRSVGLSRRKFNHFGYEKDRKNDISAGFAKTQHTGLMNARSLVP